jgi:hypothetical protein
MDDEATPTPCTVVCHTPGCPLEGQARAVGLYPNPAPPTWQVQCAQCGQMITDVTPQA